MDGRMGQLARCLRGVRRAVGLSGAPRVCSVRMNGVRWRDWGTDLESMMARAQPQALLVLVATVLVALADGE